MTEKTNHSAFYNARIPGYSEGLKELNLDLKGKLERRTDYCTAIGEFSDVWRADFDGRKVAVKVLRGGSFRNDAFMKKLIDDLVGLGTMLEQLQHPYVSEFVGLSLEFGYMPGIVMPWYPKGNIIQYLAANPRHGGEVKLHLIAQAAEGLEYLHKQGVVHGDIRGANILIDDDCTPKLCDIGLTFITGSSDFTTAKTAGSCRWASPEVLNPEQDEDLPEDSPAPYTKESDIYAFGMTILEVFTGLVPFHTRRNDVSVIFAVIKGERPYIPDAMKEIHGLEDLVQTCWKAVPKERPTAEELHNCLASSLPVPAEEIQPTEPAIDPPSGAGFIAKISALILAPITYPLRWVIGRPAQ
ncbi:kinase-like protein [Heliocybe sulcata]|uniref:Kinase-like protein n=1 Tax=Heliocybe sulcata TaxID=5364 RepID=A0A5C3N4M2_9AGAM|nr:kinase-like protein [Heliocybe sulcata]